MTKKSEKSIEQIRKLVEEDRDIRKVMRLSDIEDVYSICRNKASDILFGYFQTKYFQLNVARDIKSEVIFGQSYRIYTSAAERNLHRFLFYDICSEKVKCMLSKVQF